MLSIVQLSRFFVFVCLSRVSLDIIAFFAIFCQELFSYFLNKFYSNFLITRYWYSFIQNIQVHATDKRRKRDLNPRAAINDLLPFQGSPFSLLGISPNVSTSDIIVFNVVFCQGFFSVIYFFNWPFFNSRQFLHFYRINKQKTERISYAPQKNIFILLYLSAPEPHYRS